ncbi:hypothetical protein HI914_07420 [Erysiphe necator]|nr:hypothetical protein HI914_07420 [Erysiphe necator]
MRFDPHNAFESWDLTRVKFGSKGAEYKLMKKIGEVEGVVRFRVGRDTRHPASIFAGVRMRSIRFHMLLKYYVTTIVFFLMTIKMTYSTPLCCSKMLWYLERPGISARIFHDGIGIPQRRFIRNTQREKWLRNKPPKELDKF